MQDALHCMPLMRTSTTVRPNNLQELLDESLGLLVSMGKPPPPPGPDPKARVRNTAARAQAGRQLVEMTSRDNRRPRSVPTGRTNEP